MQCWNEVKGNLMRNGWKEIGYDTFQYMGEVLRVRMLSYSFPCIHVSHRNFYVEQIVDEQAIASSSSEMQRRRYEKIAGGILEGVRRHIAEGRETRQDLPARV